LGIKVDVEYFEQLRDKLNGQISRLIEEGFAGHPNIDDVSFQAGSDVKWYMEKHGVTNWPMTPKTKKPSFPESWLKLSIPADEARSTVFLLALSRIALSVLLALGPLFIALFLFESSRRFFEAWLAQLANYAFVTILTVLVAALMLRVVTVAAQQAVSQGGSIDIASAVRVCMAAGLTLLVMRQVMPMAAGLANGLALSSFNVVSSAVAWGLGGALRGSGQFTRGLTDRENPRWGSFARQAGYGLRSGLARAVSASRRHNEIRRSA